MPEDTHAIADTVHDQTVHGIKALKDRRSCPTLLERVGSKQGACPLQIPPPALAADMADHVQKAVNDGLEESLPLALAVRPDPPLGRAHGRQDVVVRGQAHEERERDQPDADAEEGRDLREGRDIGPVVVRAHAAVGLRLVA